MPKNNYNYIGFKLCLFMRYISRFLDWYEGHLTHSLALSAFVLYLQIPHSLWALECIWGEGVLHGHGIIVDFLLYGIDTLEMIPIIGVTLAIISKVRHKV